MEKKLKTYSDGGARGNPGPAAAAYLIMTDTGEVLDAGSRFLGKRTNNQAEYEALIFALETAENLGAEEVICHLDSELVGKHLTGKYKVKNPELKKLWNKTQQLTRRFKKVTFVNVSRTDSYIVKADELVNEILDETTKKQAMKI